MIFDVYSTSTHTLHNSLHWERLPSREVSLSMVASHFLVQGSSWIIKLWNQAEPDIVFRSTFLTFLPSFVFLSCSGHFRWWPYGWQLTNECIDFWCECPRGVWRTTSHCITLLCDSTIIPVQSLSADLLLLWCLETDFLICRWLLCCLSNSPCIQNAFKRRACTSTTIPLCWQSV